MTVPEAPRPEVIGAILTGGASSRMGQPKATLRMPDGRMMIEVVHDALRGRGREVVLVGDCDALPELRRIHDLHSGLGPLGGIEALLASGLAENYLVCPCDLPRLTSEMLAPLMHAPKAQMNVLRIEGESQPRPLPMRIRADALSVVQRLINVERFAVHALIDALAAHVIDVSAAWNESLANINTRDEYDALTKAARPPRPSREHS